MVVSPLLSFYLSLLKKQLISGYQHVCENVNIIDVLNVGKVEVLIDWIFQGRRKSQGNIKN